jgi:hypothetical protein
MLTPTKPTPEAMTAMLNTLREVRALTTGGEHQLRTLRHILCNHLQLPGSLGAFRGGREPVKHSDEEVLELLYDGLLDLAGDSEEDDRLVARARSNIATMLNKTPTVEFTNGVFRVVEAPSAYAMV